MAWDVVAGNALGLISTILEFVKDNPPILPTLSTNSGFFGLKYSFDLSEIHLLL